MKKQFFLIFILFLNLILQAQVSKTVNVNSAGGLSTALNTMEKSIITNLKVTGTIDARDFKTMRDSLLVLKTVDLSNVSIATYTGWYGTYGAPDTYYGANEIPQRAFVGCSNLVSIIIPSSVTSLNERAFAGCSSLVSFTIPPSVTYIADLVFAYDSSLTSINIPPSVTAIGNSVFYNSSNINKHTFISNIYCV